MNSGKSKAKKSYQYHSNLDDQHSRLQEELVKADPMSPTQKIEHFAKYASRRSLGRFIAHYELFKRVLGVPGSVVECGVYYGAGVMSWAKLSSLLEPNNHTRRVIGFDTFSGFPPGGEVSSHARENSAHPDLLEEGCIRGGSMESIMGAAELFDINRHISHIPKIELVPGRAEDTIPLYVEKNPHLVVSLLYLDFDLYEGTRVALKHFLPRMPKGAIIAFDEFHYDVFPGETMAVADEIGIGNLRLERFNFDTIMAYAVLD